MTYCGEHTLVKWHTDSRHAISLKCRSWLCPNCQDQRKARLIAEAIGGAPDTFLTLTSRRTQDRTPEQAAKKLAWCWRIIRLRLMRMKKTKHIPFMAVFEATQAGWPHLHILLRTTWIDFKLLTAWMAELDDSPHVYIERIKQKAKIAGYVAKYAGKCAQKFGTAKRYWKSKDYELRDKAKFEKNKGEWSGAERETMSINRWIAIFHNMRWRVEVLSPTEAIAYKPP